MDKQKIRAIANDLINESIVCNRKAAILRKLLQSNEIVDAFNQRQAGKTLGLLRSALYRDLALQCFNGLVDSDWRAISFFQVHNLLSDSTTSDLLDGLKEDFAMPRLSLYNSDGALAIHEYETLKSQLREKDKTKFDQQIHKLRAMAQRFEKNGGDFNRIRELRDKVLAHNELAELSGMPFSQQAAELKYGELWGFVRALQEAATLLHSVCNNAAFDFSGADDINLREAENFVAVFLK